MLSAQSVPTGTFVVRFRFKEPRSIAISYKVATGKVGNVKCDLSRERSVHSARSVRQFKCGKRILTLPRFILSYPQLVAVYRANGPPIDKLKAFGPFVEVDAVP